VVGYLSSGGCSLPVLSSSNSGVGKCFCFCSPFSRSSRIKRGGRRTRRRRRRAPSVQCKLDTSPVCRVGPASRHAICGGADRWARLWDGVKTSWGTHPPDQQGDACVGAPLGTLGMAAWAVDDSALVLVSWGVGCSVKDCREKLR
jgi:hypothetical protein